jgi:hypothetical protein
MVAAPSLCATAIENPAMVVNTANSRLHPIREDQAAISRPLVRPIDGVRRHR